MQLNANDNKKVLLTMVAANGHYFAPTAVTDNTIGHE